MVCSASGIKHLSPVPELQASSASLASPPEWRCGKPTSGQTEEIFRVHVPASSLFPCMCLRQDSSPQRIPGLAEPRSAFRAGNSPGQTRKKTSKSGMELKQTAGVLVRRRGEKLGIETLDLSLAQKPSPVAWKSMDQYPHTTVLLELDGNCSRC